MGIFSGRNKTTRGSKDKVIKVVFVGAGESGKTTINKQIKIKHGGGFSEQERRSYISKITKNLLFGVRQVIQATEKFETPLKTDEADAAGDRIIQLLGGTTLQQNGFALPTRLDVNVVSDIRTLLADPVFQETLKRSAEFQMEDNWGEFAAKLDGFPDKWGGKNWLPSDEDILMTRVMTVGVHTQRVTVNRAKMDIIDVGGQRQERNRWDQLFERVGAFAFVVGLSAYNQTLWEENSVNRLEEAVRTFKTCATNDNLSKSAIIVFLNKFDLFQEKYYNQGVPLVKPKDYGVEPPKKEDEKDNKCELAIRWFKNLFRSQLEGTGRKPESIIFHKCCALEKDSMDKLIEVTIQQILEETGILTIAAY